MVVVVVEYGIGTSIVHVVREVDLTVTSVIGTVDVTVSVVNIDVETLVEVTVSVVAWYELKV